MLRDHDRGNGPRVVAAFASSDRARAALDHAQRLGVDGSRLAAARIDRPDPVDPAADWDVAELVRAVHADAQRDDRVLRFVGERLLVGALLGGATGAVLAVLVAVTASAIVTTVISALVSALIGAVAGSLVGILLAGAVTAPMSPSWEQTLMGDDAHFVVSARPGDPDTLAHVVKAMEHQRPSKLVVTGSPDEARHEARPHHRAQ